MTARVQGVRSVAIDVCALDQAIAFYSSVWNLTPVEAPGPACYFRGTAAHHHILSLHPANRPAIRRVVFEAADRDAVRALHARVKASGVRDLLEKGRLVELFPDWGGEKYLLYALYPSRHLPPAKVRAFIDFLIEILEDEET